MSPRERARRVLEHARQAKSGTQLCDAEGCAKRGIPLADKRRTSTVSEHSSDAIEFIQAAQRRSSCQGPSSARKTDPDASNDSAAAPAKYDLNDDRISQITPITVEDLEGQASVA